MQVAKIKNDQDFTVHIMMVRSVRRIVVEVQVLYEGTYSSSYYCTVWRYGQSRSTSTVRVRTRVATVLPYLVLVL
jgi:hypothetical protein